MNNGMSLDAQVKKRWAAKTADELVCVFLTDVFAAERLAREQSLRHCGVNQHGCADLHASATYTCRCHEGRQRSFTDSAQHVLDRYDVLPFSVRWLWPDPRSRTCAATRCVIIGGVPRF